VRSECGGAPRRERSSDGRAMSPTATTATTESSGRPFVKWVGGKRQLLPKLLEHVPKPYRHYYEPFAGGGALFFALRQTSPRREMTIADTNIQLVRTYWAVKTNVEKVIALLSTYPYDEKFYYTKRAETHHRTDIEAAAWFIYMNKAGFNGLYRVNKRGEFNVPFGRYTNPTICDAANLRACSVALQGVEILATPYYKTASCAAKGDLVYFDPPYWPTSATANFVGYTAGGFGQQDQVALRDFASALKRDGVHVILSNADLPEVRELYTSKKGFTIHRVEARRNVNSNAKKRGAVGELIIT
jgi:DNA adenine methylase